MKSDEGYDYKGGFVSLKVAGIKWIATMNGEVIAEGTEPTKHQAKTLCEKAITDYVKKH